MTDFLSAPPVPRAVRHPLLSRSASHTLAGAALAGLALVGGGARVAAAQPARPAAPAATRLDFVDARLADVIRALASTLGLNVVLADVPDRRVTFRTTSPVRADEVGQVLESILESNGLVLVRQGSVARVLPADRAPAAGPLGVGFDFPDPPPLGLVTQLVPLQSIRADEGAATLRQIASPTARIEAVARSNALLVTDRGVNVARYLDVLRRLDAKPEGEAGLRTYVVPLKYANADDLSAALGQLFGVTTAAARGGSLDDRSLGRALDTFRQRDQETYQQRALVPGPAGTLVPQRTATPSPMTAATGALAAAAAQGALGRADTAGGRAAGALVGQTTIVANAPTNALIIRTLPPNFPVLRETIEALDVRPVQVLLQVTVAEVALGRGVEFGIDWEAATRGAGNTNVQAGAGGLAVDSGTPNGGLLVRRILRVDNLDVRALLRTVASTNRVNVISTPEILAANNREARILVGSRVPFVASTRLGDFARDLSVQYQDVGTTLTIVPTINEDDYVSVQILQEVSQLTTRTLASAFNAPLISTREAATRAVLRNGQTVIIGGLIGDERTTGDVGIPLLKDVPVLGHLFKRTTATRNRTELAIFVTPYVVRTDADADRLRERAPVKYPPR